MDIVIIEDELLAVKNLKSILNESNDINVIATLESIAESVAWFRINNPPDLVFMDIHLADGLAFEIFEQTSVRCPIIFTTAYDEYALKAFRVNGIDYLLKPLNVNTVNKSIQKFRTLNPYVDLNPEFKKLLAAIKQEKEYKTNFLITTKGDKLVPLSVDKIAYICVDNGITKAITFDEKSFFLDHTLDEMIGMLNPSLFIRANRQYIISRIAIKDIDLWFNNKLAVNLKIPTSERILISRERNSIFKNWFTNS